MLLRVFQQTLNKNTAVTSLLQPFYCVAVNRSKDKTSIRTANISIVLVD